MVLKTAPSGMCINDEKMQLIQLRSGMIAFPSILHPTVWNLLDFFPVHCSPIKNSENTPGLLQEFNGCLH